MRRPLFYQGLKQIWKDLRITIKHHKSVDIIELEKIKIKKRKNVLTGNINLGIIVYVVSSLQDVRQKVKHLKSK